VLVTTDPLGINPYAYTHNNPIGTSDPTGLMHNPDQPAPACGSTTQNCGANGDGSSNGYSQTPPPAAPWLPGWFEASLSSDHGADARRDAIAEYIRDTAPTGTPQEVADRQQIYDYYCATYHAENCSPSTMQVASGLAGAATVLTGGFELEGGLEAAGTGITRILGKDAAGTATKTLPESLSFGSRAAAREGLPGDLAGVGNRFFRGATGKSQDFQAVGLPGGGYRLQFFSPADNPGYGKLYVQEIDRSGNIVSRYKDTMGPDGLIERKFVQ
jgi:hypothetical protein